MGGQPEHTRNTAYLAGVEAFWGLGMNLLSMGTVQAFMVAEILPGSPLGRSSG
mgnify:CR=1 FL=1